MNGTVSYIKELQKRIEELSSKRDELKKLSFDLTSSGFHRRTSSNEYSLRSSAVVRQSLDGVEAVVRSRHDAQASTLSRVLQLLLEEGLDVINCISTRIDGGLIHIIKLEVIGVRGVDLPYLQQKVNEEISSLNRT
ncbi:putative Basic helix-loop-helix DNA-binding superfamily protein [Hibiscus syriacus]|uniref:Basic helix-loop-helix DNA-binding superfamily protein n=2 Tax=Hibiscus syriacus TaxID=106335 RepID=A0A6A3A2D4_HIBSY|nr:putative Basic helix-loop-helix DNA-binding superfamily protein [Hibiscus syriacus]